MTDPLDRKLSREERRYWAKKIRDLNKLTTPWNEAEHAATNHKGPHHVLIEDVGNGVSLVTCACGFTQPAHYGEQQAAKIKDNHLARMLLAPDPMGARYGNQ